jgi:hypothetical protein
VQAAAGVSIPVHVLSAGCGRDYTHPCRDAPDTVCRIAQRNVEMTQAFALSDVDNDSVVRCSDSAYEALQVGEALEQPLRRGILCRS